MEWPGFDLGIPGPMDTSPPFFFFLQHSFFFSPLENGSLPLEFTLGKRDGSSFTKLGRILEKIWEKEDVELGKKNLGSPCGVFPNKC